MYLTFVKAVILILKHATLLQLPTSLQLPIIQSESDYQQANTDLKIQQYLVAFSSKHSIKNFVAFIMATDIGALALASVSIVSH